MRAVRIKICGVTTAEDAEAAALLGAAAVGLNYYPPSPRHVLPEAVPAILRILPPFVEAVGVFVARNMGELVAQVPTSFRTIQWHGEDRDLGGTCPYRLITAFAVSERGHLEEISRYLTACRQEGRLPAAILIDARREGLYGGTGQLAPWELLAEFRPEVPLILAGGLTPDNVADAVRIVRPYAVDVASGVEVSPGKKDVEKMRRFIENARAAL